MTIDTEHKHTPNYHVEYGETNDDRSFAVVERKDSGHGEWVAHGITDRSTAELFAAAPKMWAALRNAKDTIETLLNGNHYRICSDAGIELSGLEGEVDSALAAAAGKEAA